MRRKIVKFTGWFGMLTPIFCAGVLLGMWSVATPELWFVGRLLIVSVVNYRVGRGLLNWLDAPRVEVKKGARA